jgi:hypothetical protein
MTIPPLLARCERHEPDVIVISEFRDTQAGTMIRTELRRLGFAHQAGTDNHRGNGVLVAAIQPFESLVNPLGLAADQYSFAVVQATFGELCLYGSARPRP